DFRARFLKNSGELGKARFNRIPPLAPNAMNAWQWSCADEAPPTPGSQSVPNAPEQPSRGLYEMKPGDKELRRKTAEVRAWLRMKTRPIAAASCLDQREQHSSSQQRAQQEQRPPRYSKCGQKTNEREQEVPFRHEHQ